MPILKAFIRQGARLMVDELKTALLAAGEAAKIADEHWGAPSTLKHDNSPVTVADTMAEEVIRNIILGEFPDHAILGEEGGMEGKSDYTWVIDPIDGTLLYSRGMKYFTTLIALFYKGDIVLGVSNAPKMNELMYAKQGEGAYLNGEKITVSTVSKLEEALVMHSNLKSFVSTNKLDNLKHLEKITWRLRGYGNLLGAHAVASGRAEAFVSGQLKIWDVAALAVIVTEAGGKATDIKGNKLSLLSTSALLTNGLLHSNLLMAFNRQEF